MSSRAPITFRHIITRPVRSTPVFLPERYSDLVRRRGGPVSVPGRLPSAAGMTTEDLTSRSRGSQNRLTKLLLNVNIERSLGPVQVFMAPESTVKDLIKATIEIYSKEKRRPLLKSTNPDCYQLHYSQFSLESLEPDEKLINLGSRNFFLCIKSLVTINPCYSDGAKKAIRSGFPFIKLMDFLL